jgi:hypothetical protein
VFNFGAVPRKLTQEKGKPSWQVTGRSYDAQPVSSCSTRLEIELDRKPTPADTKSKLASVGTLMRQFTVLLLVLMLAVQGVASAQTTDTLVLSVLLFDPPRTETTRIWLAIKNTGKAAMTLCRPFWGYGWLSSDPGGPAAIEAHASIHGCGDDDHDPLWLLLPGETRFDSYEVKGTGNLDAGGTLSVDVEVLQHILGTDSLVSNISLSWKGKVSDALAAGERMRLGKF